MRSLLNENNRHGNWPGRPANFNVKNLWLDTLFFLARWLRRLGILSGLTLIWQLGVFPPNVLTLLWLQ